MELCPRSWPLGTPGSRLPEAWLGAVHIITESDSPILSSTGIAMPAQQSCIQNLVGGGSSTGQGEVFPLHLGKSYPALWGCWDLCLLGSVPAANGHSGAQEPVLLLVPIQCPQQGLLCIWVVHGQKADWSWFTVWHAHNLASSLMPLSTFLAGQPNHMRRLPKEGFHKCGGVGLECLFIPASGLGRFDREAGGTKMCTHKHTGPLAHYETGRMAKYPLDQP